MQANDSTGPQKPSKYELDMSIIQLKIPITQLAIPRSLLYFLLKKNAKDVNKSNAKLKRVANADARRDGPIDSDSNMRYMQ